MNYGNGNNSFNNFNNQPNQMPPYNNMQSNMSNTNMGGNLYDFSQDMNSNTQYNGYSNENTTFKSSKKKRFSFFALLEFLIIVFLCLYIANDKGYIHISFLDNLIPAKEQKKEEPVEKEEEPKPSSEEAVVTDSKLVAEFKLRAYYMGNIGVNFANLISPIFSKDTKVEDLTDTMKIQSILMGELTIEKNYKDLADENEYKEVFPTESANPSYQMAAIKYVDAATVSARYKMIYGKEPTHASIPDNCPIYVYNEKYNKYYMNPYCGDKVDNRSINQFAYKITAKDDKYYVYISVATFYSNEDGSIIVYKDPKLEEKYKDYKTAEEFQIDSSNYDNFSKYKITFVKNGEEYTFSSIEKIENEKTDS